MDVFQLMGKIAIDTAQSNKAMDETSAKGEKTEKSLKKSFSAIGKAAGALGKAVAAGLAAGSAAVGKLFVKSMNLAGELEQQLGGSEAVFGEYAKDMQDASKRAYRSMGLSQSEFLATANKMGSLLQGSGFEASEAADLTTQAMQRAADVASIMGIDTSAAMEAIAGAAKGNFTMMDNLGVAINDTTLANYALSKGITKSTANMTTQEKIALAMELFMEKSAYAAGNYAKENDTLAGSLSTAKAALENYLTGNANPYIVVDAFSRAADVIVANATALAPKLAQGISQIVKKLTPKIAELVHQVLPGIIEGAVYLLTGLAEVLPDLIVVLVEQIPYIIEQLAVACEQSLPAIVEAFSKSFQSIVNNLPSILQSIGRIITSVWGNGIWPMVQSLFKAVFGIELPDWSSIREKIAGWWELLKTKVNEICQAVFGISAGEAWENVKSVFVEWWNGIKGFVSDIFTAVWGLANGTLTWEDVKEKFVSWWNGIKGAVETVFQAIFSISGGETWENIKEKFTTWWNSIKDYVGAIFSAVWKLADGTLTWDDVKNIFVTWWNTIVSSVEGIFQAVFGISGGETWENIKEIFTTWWNGIKENVSAIFTAVWKIASDGETWETIKGIFTTWWNSIKDYVGAIFTAVWKLAEGTLTWEDVKAIFVNWWNGIKNTVSSIFTAVWKIAENGETWETVESIFKTWWDSIVSNVESIFKAVFSILPPNVQKTINAIQQWWEGIVNSVSLFLGFSTEEESVGSGHGGHYANGTDFVNRDQMPAILHYGEAVLNRTDAKNWRDGSSTSGMIELASKMDAVLQALESGFANIGSQQIVLDSGVLVGSLANGIDSQLGRMASYRSRRG